MMVIDKEVNLQLMEILKKIKVLHSTGYIADYPINNNEIIFFDFTSQYQNCFIDIGYDYASAISLKESQLNLLPKEIRDLFMFNLDVISMRH